MSNEELDRIESSDNHRLALEQIVIAKDLPCTMRSVQQEIRCERESRVDLDCRKCPNGLLCFADIAPSAL